MKSSPLNSTRYATLYPQNGDRIVAIDSVTSLHTMYTTSIKGISETAFGQIGRPRKSKRIGLSGLYWRRLEFNRLDKVA